MKKVITALLIAAFLLLPVQVKAPEPQPEMFAQCVIAILVIAVGTVCIIGIVKCCKLLNQLDPPAPPTNTIPPLPTNNIPTNYPPAWTNPQLAKVCVTMLTTNTIITAQQSIGLSDWADLATVQLTNRGSDMVLTSGSLCLTSVLNNNVAVFFLPPVTEPPSDSKFFRLLSTP